MHGSGAGLCDAGCRHEGSTTRPMPLVIRELLRQGFQQPLCRATCFVQLRCASYASIMEVTASNFQASLPRILQAISEANFVAIDTELSGLRPVDAVRELSIDSFDARWAKVRFSASSMAMLQLGICTFRLDETSGVWTTQPFTLYVCPDSNLSLFEHDARHSFVSQTSAIHFLGRNGFDFNTMAKDSIPYLSEARAVQAEQLARADVFRRFKRVRTTFFGRAPPRAIIVGTPVSPAAGASGNGNGDSAAMSITSDADCQWFTEFKGCVEAWMAACVAPGVGGGVPPTDGLTNAAATLVESRTSTVAGFPQLTLSGCNSFQRAVMHAHVARVSEQRVVCLTEEVAPGEDSYRQDVSLSWVGDAAGFEAWERVWARKAVDVANANASNASGLLRVVKALVESGHPIVGHNCMLDVAHIGDKFFGPAPLDLTAFAQSWLRHFPITFDTKHLLCTAVGELVDAAKLRPFTSRTDLGGAYKAVTSPHLLAQVWPVSSGAHLQDTESADGVAAPLVPSAPKPLCTTRFPPGLTIPFNVPAAQPAATPVAEGVADPTAVGIDVDDAAHDAGADAYMTGVVFASVLEMAHRVAGNDAPFVWPANVCVTAGSMTAETAGAAAMVAMPSNPLMRQTANKLHMMRCTVPWQKTLNLEDAACAAAASSSVGAGTTENSVERSRQTVNHNNLLWIRSEGLLTCNTLDDVRGFVASGLGIRPALIDR